MSMTTKNIGPANKMAKMTSSSSSMVVGDEVDMISNLPDALIIQILSFLPTEDVFRTCILSKRWKLIWYSVPTLFFSSDDTIYDVEKFYSFVENYFEHREKGIDSNIVDLGITSFELYIYNYYCRSKGGILDKLLSFAVKNKVKEMYVFIGKEIVEEGGDYSDHYYCLPKILDNARFLTILELYGVKLDTSSCSFSFPSLKTLSLEQVYHLEDAKEDGVVKFLLGCPSLEKLGLYDYCFYGMNVQLQSLSLKFMELMFVDIDDIEVQIEVEAINLESLVVDGIPLNRINFSSCKKIRDLSLPSSRDNSPLSSFEALISNIPLVENLALSCNSSKSEHLKISSQHLKCFDFENRCYSYNGGEMKVVTIESAPKLAYISYQGNLNFKVSMESSSLVNGKIIILDARIDYDTKWFIDLLNFFVNLSYSWNTVTLKVCNYESLIWPENLPKNLKNLFRYPLVSWKHLEVFTNYDPEKESDLKEALMWISPSLETLSINEKVIF
ncbi:F-box/FBD/LRR-repeat protein At3g26920-like [Cannabis sativa]|uniref:F-box/FBD/LRR-repeat protein At3g26920-like n=1 Tax=Cannabis sativa TaxID=3483 RepID=UPI0029CA1BD9|nr:F-box/FBD/LRR-repeat protein At3g26920-like [Cannabis sativa]